MPRLFIAIDLPDAHKVSLASCYNPHLSARWTREAQFHLTLRFLGDVSSSRLNELFQSLGHIRAPSFMLDGQGLGVFPNLRRPRVLFASLIHTPPLQALRERIEQACISVGFEPELKGFHPHVTLARIKRASSSEVRAFLRRHEDFYLPPFAVTAFQLYESVLNPKGAIHRLLASYDLMQTSGAEQDPP